MQLTEQDRERAEVDDDESPAMSFTLAVKGANTLSYELSFDDVERAAEFQRDFRVRQRLMDLALKASRRQEDASRAHRELEQLQGPSPWQPILRAWRSVQLIVTLLLLLLLVAVATP